MCTLYFYESCAFSFSKIMLGQYKAYTLNYCANIINSVPTSSRMPALSLAKLANLNESSPLLLKSSLNSPAHAHQFLLRSSRILTGLNDTLFNFTLVSYSSI